MPTVADLLQRKKPGVVTVRPDQTVAEAVSVMCIHDTGAAIVIDDGKVVGIFTERDVLKRVVAQLRAPDRTPVREVMTHPVACCKPSTTLDECRRVMALERMRHLPVVEDDRLLGIVSIRDILTRQIQIDQTTVQYLHDYLHGKM